MEKVSQKRLILAYLSSNPRGITPAEAADLFDCWRLAARIAELRSEGFEIETVEETNKNGGRHARYYLVNPVAPWAS